MASFYNRKQAQSPDTVARIVIAGIKKGTFLITTTPGMGPFLVVLTRGFGSSDSFLRNLVEAICAGPVRIVSYFANAVVYQRLKKIHSKHNPGS